MLILDKKRKDVSILNHAELTTVKEAVAQNLLFYRKRNRMTQRELAEKLGVKHNSISSWENGINSIDIEILSKICDIFNISINDMFSKEQAEKEYYTEHEQSLVRKYRAKIEMQHAVDVLLDLAN